MAKHKTPYKDLLPPLSTEETAALKADIKKNGVLHPCFVDEEGNVLDGHNRLSIDPSADTRVITGLSEAEKIAFVLSMNFKRRNLSPEQKANVRQSMKETAFRLREESPKKWTQSAVARVLGVSRQCVAKWYEDSDISNSTSGNANKPLPDARVSIRPHEKLDIVERVGNGEKQRQIAADYGINQSRVSQIVTAENKKKENKAKQNAIAEKEVEGVFDGLYDVIVIDPPWPMEKIDREVRPNQSEFDYPTMSEQELSEMSLPSSADCHAWVWTTHKFMPMAMRLLENWGLRYVCTFVWHKPGGFQPIGLPQYNCEFALYARKGSPTFSDTKSFSTCFQAPRGSHSEKPEEFYELLRRVTQGRRIDIFNRRRIEGFDAWGNEA